MVATTGESRSDHNIRLVLSAAFKEFPRSSNTVLADASRFVSSQEMDTNADGLVSEVEWKACFQSKEKSVGCFTD